MKLFYDIIVECLNESIKYPLATGQDHVAFGGDVGWKGVIVWAQPSRFLELASHLTSKPDSERVARLADKIRNGTPIDPTVLITSRGKVVVHEGRHRAIAAQQLGVEQIPILVIPRDFPRVPQWTASEYRVVQSLDFVPEG